MTPCVPEDTKSKGGPLGYRFSHIVRPQITLMGEDDIHIRFGWDFQFEHEHGLSPELVGHLSCTPATAPPSCDTGFRRTSLGGTESRGRGARVMGPRPANAGGVPWHVRSHPAAPAVYRG